MYLEEDDMDEEKFMGVSIHSTRAVTSAAVKLAKGGNKEEAAKLLEQAHRALHWRDPERFRTRCICGDAEWYGTVAHALELHVLAVQIGAHTYCPEFSSERPAPLRDMVPGNWLKESILKDKD